MAHNLNFNEQANEHAFFSRKEIAWHGLGQVVPEALTSEEALKIAHLDFDVELHPSQVQFEDGEKRTIPNKFASVRMDTRQPLGIVGNRYEIIQNRQAFEFIDAIVGEKLAVYETAGALGDGQTVFVTAKLPDNIRIGKTDDIIEKYIMFTNTHDGTAVGYAGFTPVRVVCNNTLVAALNGLQNRVSFRHTKNVHDRIKQGMDLLGLYKVYANEFKAQLEKLAKIKVKDDDVQRIAQMLLLNDEEAKDVVQVGIGKSDAVSTRKMNLYTEFIDYIDRGVGQELHRGTGLWLYNGVSSYYNNAKKYQTEELRLRRLLNGESQQNTQLVMDTLLAGVK